MSWWILDTFYMEENINIINDYSYEYSCSIREIPKWFINLLEEINSTIRDIDYDLSWDQSVENNFFENKKLKLINIIKEWY